VAKRKRPEEQTLFDHLESGGDTNQSARDAAARSALMGSGGSRTTLPFTKRRSPAI